MPEFTHDELETMYQTHRTELAMAHLATLPVTRLTDGVGYARCVCSALVAPDLRTRHAGRCESLKIAASAAELARWAVTLTDAPPYHAAEVATDD